MTDQRTRELDNVGVVEQLVAALHAWDADAWASYHTADSVGVAVLSGSSWQGRDAARRNLLAWKETFSSLHNDIVGIYPSGDHVILEVVATFTLAKEHKGQPAGTQRQQHELFVYRFEDGRIAETRAYS